MKKHSAAWSNKAELEAYLSEHVGGEPVSVVDENPTIVTDVPLIKYGLIGSAVIYKGSSDGKLYAVLVPFGVGIKSAA